MKPICFDCAWLFQQGDFHDMDNEEEEFTCLAFYPAPIPEDIWLGRNGHHEPHADQGGNDIVYAPLRKYVKPRK
jgi:hypothetical protein